MLKKDEMTIRELYRLLDEYERMLGLARERNNFSQEFRLQDMIDELKQYIIERVGVETDW